MFRRNIALDQLYYSVMKYSTVHKFGGTSLASAQLFERACSFLPSEPTMVVVSAAAGVTQKLSAALECAINGQPFAKNIEDVARQYQAMAEQLLSQEDHTALTLLWHSWFDDTLAVLTSVSLVATVSQAESAQVLGLGECLSASLMAALLSNKNTATWLDARKTLYTNSKHGVVAIDWQRSVTALQEQLSGVAADYIVITGFLAADADGHQMLLDRNGSDFSAAAFAELINANSLWIWSDQDGVFSADPRWVKSAFPLPELSYQEALELAYFGAAIIHPKTIDPCLRSSRPIYVKNSLRPEQPGTLISAAAQPCEFAVRGVSSLSGLSIITIEGAGMIGVSGIAARAFSSLEQENISVVLISQASSEHSICLCVQSVAAQAAEEALNKVFEFEIRQGDIARVVAEHEVAVVAAVGDGMVGRTGIAGRMCQTLALAGVNIRAIAQGASERNISIVVSEQEVKKAVQVLHAGFYLSAKTIAIGLIGVGVIGSELLEQIIQVRHELQEKENIALIPRAIANSTRMFVFESSDELKGWRKSLEQSDQPYTVDAMTAALDESECPYTAVIDCTANQGVAESYLQFLRAGCHIITPNKRAGSGDLSYYQELKQTLKDTNRRFFYEATVCAGLPVIHTLQDLLRTGDQVQQIEGIVSGSLSFIFYSLRQGMSFSEAVLEAKSQGFTEPDPRDDLSGMDVMRKMVCLARELGFSISLSNVSSQNLVPKDLRDVDVDEFLQRLPEYDDAFKQSLAEQSAEDGVWCYVGTIDNDGQVSVTMQPYPRDHPFAKLTGTDNMIIFHTDRYDDQPLVIQGPGAGAAVTASGVFADLLRLMAALGED